MVQRSKISQLPQDVREALERKLVANGFAGYVGLADWLAEQGYDIRKSAVHEYGQALERKLEAIRASTTAARSIAEAAPDDADLRSAAVMSLVQTEIFDVMVTLQEAEDAEPTERLKLLSRAAKSIAELSRASVNQKKWQEQVGARVAIAQKAVDGAARRGRLQPEDADTIRAAIRQILG